jgi:RNA polymerase sigma-70 factor (ECF subfamily)
MKKKFEEIYAAHADAVFRFAVRLVGRRDLAEDIASEAFLELFRHWDRVDLDRLPAWLYTVARNRATDYWRRRAAEERYAFDYEEPEAAPPVFEPKLFDNDVLKPVHRVCLILRYVHGMTRVEIAAYTGLSEMQIKGHLQYAHQLLRTQLTKTTPGGL